MARWMPWVPWLLLLLVGLALATRRIRRRSPEVQPSTLPPPIVPRITILPHVDAGMQVVSGMGRKPSRTISMTGHIDMGVQYLRVAEAVPGVLIEMGGRQ
jgi:hypothetical protein